MKGKNWKNSFPHWQRLYNPIPGRPASDDLPGINKNMIMTEKDLLNNKEAMKLALAFDKMAKEYKTTIQKVVAEGKRVTELIQNNRMETISTLSMIENLINEHEPDSEKREKMLSLLDNLNIKGDSKTFPALVMALFFASNGVLTEKE